MNSLENLEEQVKKLAVETDDAGRRKLSLLLRDLSYSLEAPKDTITRIASYPLRTAAVRSGIDLKLFHRLAATDKPLDIESLAKYLGVEASLIGRYLRYFASFGMITETRNNFFSANNTTKVLADPGKEACIIHFFDTVGPVYQSLPTFLRETSFTQPSNPSQSAFQIAYSTPLTAFEYFPSLPAASLEAFGKYQASRSADMSTWLSVYPFEEEAGECGEDDVLFVDLGGGIGHQCVALRQKYPGVKGRVMVQDLEHSIKGKLDHEGVEGMVHDIFEEQPIKGARFYYLRAVLHDFPDDACQKILSRIKDAMSEKSRILIEEMVLPNSGVDWAATHTDLTMMACFAAKERTQEQWESLLDSAGLKIQAQRTYEGGWGGYEGIITVAKK